MTALLLLVLVLVMQYYELIPAASSTTKETCNALINSAPLALDPASTMGILAVEALSLMVRCMAYAYIRSEIGLYGIAILTC